MPSGPAEPPKVATTGGPAIRRLVTGLWQMADQERDGRPYDLDAAAEALVGYARVGFDTFDMADHYGSAEVVAGRAARLLRAEGRPAPVLMTKWCPPPGPVDDGTVRHAVETALGRMGLDRVDVMQLHWWRYESTEWLDALHALARLREEGLIGAVGLTNFDAEHLRMACLDGVPVATNQVCLSLVDRRATGRMAEVAQAHGVTILAFGTLLGGLLSDRSVDAPEPAEVPDWSRMKYLRFVQAAGGWQRFQRLLAAAAEVARRHEASVSNVATRWVLDQAGVGGAIVGARLGEREHRADNLRALALDLTDRDRAELAAALAALDPIPGDCGDEYRRPPFLTASGDLSHHLGALPPPFPVEPVPGRPARRRARSGSVWEERAGFSRAVRAGRRILVSGTTATDAAGRPVCPGDAEGQAAYALDKALGAVVALGGASEDVVRTRLYVARADDWEAASRAHARRFAATGPANTLVQAGLVGPYLVEVEIEAEVEDDPRGD